MNNECTGLGLSYEYVYVLAFTAGVLHVRTATDTVAQTLVLCTPPCGSAVAY